MEKQGPRNISWRDEFSTGITSIDDQHKRMLDLLNQLNFSDHNQTAHAPQTNRLLEILEELNNFAGSHFQHEEALMSEHLPSGDMTADHLVAHRTYWTIVMTLRNRLVEGDMKTIGESVSHLNRWWIEHILKTDQELGRELNRRGVF